MHIFDQQRLAEGKISIVEVFFTNTIRLFGKPTDWTENDSCSCWTLDFLTPPHEGLRSIEIVASSGKLWWNGSINRKNLLHTASKGASLVLWNQVDLSGIEAPSHVNTTLDGSTYSGWKMCHSSQVNCFLVNKNASGYIWDQCCHLQSVAASLFT